MKKNETKLAVLIDAENITEKAFPDLFLEIAKIGEVAVKRIYGDFTSSANARWKNILNKYAIKPISQFAYTQGKNASDSVLIIDAMDLLHTQRFDGFCIVSSDSDFTGLAMRIREEGLKVFGFGAKKTPESFRNACNQFTFIELLEKTATPATNTTAADVPTTTSSRQTQGKTLPQTVNESIPYDLIKKAIEISCDETGFASASVVGSELVRMKPDFDARLYKKGNAPFTTILREKTDMFEVKKKGTNLFVKLKS